jgi:hypothetical protein
MSTVALNEIEYLNDRALWSPSHFTVPSSFAMLRVPAMLNLNMAGLTVKTTSAHNEVAWADGT